MSIMIFAASECVDEGLTIRDHIDFPLGSHVAFDYFLLFFSEAVGQRVPGSHELVKCLGILTVALEASLAGAHMYYIIHLKIRKELKKARGKPSRLCY